MVSQVPPHIEQLDIWAGFPCVDLSAVKFNRQNLKGEHSGLFREVLRILELIRRVFGRNFPVYFFIENVCAAKEISEALGVRRYKLQSSDAVPISRPRYCWTNKALPLMPGVVLEDKGDYVVVTAQADYPDKTQCLRPDS